MPDALHALLNAEADRLVAGAQVPPLRVPPRRSRAWAPLAAAASVVALVLAVQAVHRPSTGPTAVRPAALTTVVPPDDVRARLGATPGHVDGPPVADADLQAESSADDGVVLRTVAVTRPRGAKTDLCRVTYTDPDAAYLQGACTEFASTDTGVTAEQRRALGRPFLSGQLPAGAAGVLLRSPGRPERVVPVADPGTAWQSRPAYVAWWPRTATDVVALAADGHELGRLHVPGEEPTRTSDDDPELGTVELPLAVRQGLDQPDLLEELERQNAAAAGVTPQPRPTPAGDRADLLLRVELGPGVRLDRYGVRSTDGRSCQAESVLRLDEDPPRPAQLGCNPPLPPDVQPPIEASRSFEAAVPGHVGLQAITGTAPPGTVTVRLTSAEAAPREVHAFDSGPRWGRRAYFAAAWPSRGHTTVTALDAAGKVLATTLVRGADLHAFDADVLEQVADCLERQGVEVVRHLQGDGAPAYDYRFGALGPEQGDRLAQQCEDAATGQR